MRAHPTICIFAILCSLIVFFYFTFRDKINSEYSSVSKILDRNLLKSRESPTMSSGEQQGLWQISKIWISYQEDSKILKTINDKIINSKKFNTFLFDFLNRSQIAKKDILAQSNYFTKDFNATNFLSTLFYTKYDGQNDEKHIIVTKGKTKKNATILKIAILKALPVFYKNSEDSILSITETKSLRQKIDLLEKKSTDLISRLNIESQRKNDDLGLISVNSEINLLQEELHELNIIKNDLEKSKAEKWDDDLLKYDYLRNYGKIEEYVFLIQQLTRLSKNNPNSSTTKEILSNKAKLSELILKEYDDAILELNQDITNKTDQINNLRQKVINSSGVSSNSSTAIPELALLEKVNSTLVKLKNEYYTQLEFWNSSKNQIMFSAEESSY